MTGSAQEAPQRSLVCSICTESVLLETSNTDEHGRSVHEECYVRKTISRFRRRQRSSRPQNWLSAIRSRFSLRLRVIDNC